MSIIDSFKDKGNQQGGIITFPPSVALEIIDHLESAEKDVLGIDGFKITPDSTQPFMEHSIDFKYAEQNWDRARKFLEGKKGMGLEFEIVAQGE